MFNRKWTQKIKTNHKDNYPQCINTVQALAGMNNQTNPVTNKSSCQIWRANQPLAQKDSPTITTYYKNKRMKHQSKNVKHTNQTTRNCTNGANIKCTNQATTPSKSQTKAGTHFSSLTCFEDCRWRASAQTTIQCTNEQTSNVQTKQPVHPSHKPRLASTSLLSPVLKTAGTDNHPTHKPNKHQLYKPSNQAIQVTNQGWQALLSSRLFWRLHVKNQTTIQCTNQTNIKPYKPSKQSIQVTKQGWHALLSSHLFWRLQVKRQCTDKLWSGHREGGESLGKEAQDALSLLAQFWTIQVWCQPQQVCAGHGVGAGLCTILVCGESNADQN